MKNKFNPVIRRLLGCAALVSVLTSGAIAREKETALSAARLTTTDVAGLQAPGQILVDVWGIPHIYAGNEHDLFFLQGFNAARDRLWQIDLWRKRGLGLLAERFRPGLSWSRTGRCGSFSTAATWRRNGRPMGPRRRPVPRPSSPGVNAYVADVRAGKRPLPDRVQDRRAPAGYVVGGRCGADPQPRIDATTSTPRSSVRWWRAPPASTPTGCAQA